MNKFEVMIERRMRKAVEEAKKECSESDDNARCGLQIYIINPALIKLPKI